MCAIDTVFLMKNGSNLSASCTAILTDIIITDTVFTGVIADNGISVYGEIAIRVPDGTTRQSYNPDFSMINGSDDTFVTIPISIWSTGAYQIINAFIENTSNGVSRCSGIPSV